MCTEDDVRKMSDLDQLDVFVDFIKPLFQEDSEALGSNCEDFSWALIELNPLTGGQQTVAIALSETTHCLIGNPYPRE